MNVAPLFKILNNLDVYQYIAENTPDAANGICIQYGFNNVKNIGELANTLQVVVATHGEPALKSIMDLHPDKDTIIELFQKKETPVATVSADGGCSCKKNADGAAAQAISPAHQTNTYILVAALIVSISIISMKK